MTPPYWSRLHRPSRLTGIVLFLGLCGGCGSFVTPTVGPTFHASTPASPPPAADGTAGAGSPPPGLRVEEFPLDSPPPQVRLRADDVVRFAVYGHPELNYDATIEPDGKVVFPLLGSFTAGGMTVEELHDRVMAAMTSKLAVNHVLLKTGDSITMTVWQQPELTRSATVQLDGKVVLPLVGEIRAASRPVADIQREVQTKLHAELENPLVSILPDRLALNDLASAEISVLPVRLNPRNVAVIGEVQNAGLVPIHARLRLTAALAEAKPTDTAELNDVIVVRHMPDGNPGYRSFRISDYTKGKAMGEDIELQDSDLVVVPKTTIGAIDVFVDQFFLRTLGVFYWWIELQQARVAIDAANEITLLNSSLRTQQNAILLQ